MEEFAELIERKLRGVAALSPDQTAVLGEHCAMLLRWNARLNLTSVKGLAEIVERHYCESLFLGMHLPAGAWSVADVGSGPGFPGVPLAVLRPECRISLIESHQRKAVFLRESTRRLANVRVMECRAEHIEERFDWVISRAVAWADLRHISAQLAPRAALLTGDIAASEMPEYEWGRRIALPWGDRRYLWIGQAVSRETGMERFT